MKKFNMKLFLISMSPWPLMLSLDLYFLACNIINLLSKLEYFYLFMNLMLIYMMMFFWWNDVIMESTILGFHTKYIMLFTINSMIMFIISEIFFFVSFFWTFFYSMFSPDIQIGSYWPSMGIMSLNYLSIPMLNSLLLISSGCSLTWSHYKILSNNKIISKYSLLITMMLGKMFMFLQMFEYKMSNFCFSDSIYGSIFFISTGFHGIHVTIGILFLMFMFFRMSKNHFSKFHLLGFEFSIWYWHFVDVVWLYLYMCVYWLGF